MIRTVIRSFVFADCRRFASSPIVCWQTSRIHRVTNKQPERRLFISIARCVALTRNLRISSTLDESRHKNANQPNTHIDIEIDRCIHWTHSDAVGRPVRRRAARHAAPGTPTLSPAPDISSTSSSSSNRTTTINEWLFIVLFSFFLLLFKAKYAATLDA